VALTHVVCYITYKFLLTYHSNSGPILHRFRDSATYWPNIVNFIPFFYLQAQSLRVLWRCMCLFHTWGVTLCTLRWGDPGSVDVF